MDIREREENENWSRNSFIFRLYFLDGECFRDENVILLSEIFLKEIVK